MVRNRDMSGSACTRAEQGNHRAGMVGNEKRWTLLSFSIGNHLAALRQTPSYP